MLPERSIFDKLEVDDSEGGIGIDDNNVKLTKKSRKLKGQNFSKSQKLAKLGKKSSKYKNSTNFDVKENKPSF